MRVCTGCEERCELGLQGGQAGSHNPRQAEMLAHIDSYRGPHYTEPTDAEVKRIAKRFGDSCPCVRVAFHAKPDRFGAKRYAMHTWEPWEDEIIRKYPRNQRAAARVNADPRNKKRGCTRTWQAIGRRRSQLKQREEA